MVPRIVMIFYLNRKKNRHHYRTLLQQSKPGHDQRVETYVLTARTQLSAMGDSFVDVWIRFGFDREFVLSNLIRTYISYLNGQ